MCLEDIRLGRKTASIQTNFALTATPVRVATTSDLRTCLIFVGDVAEGILLQMDGANSGATGALLASNASWQQFDVATHGQLCTNAWWAATITGTALLTVFETFLNER